MQQLPPLKALRAFVAVARALSFSRAAKELHVTPGAITHQIKVLEKYLGVELLSRDKRSVSLTQAGSACLPDLEAGFRSLTLGIERLNSHANRLTISVAPSFASAWLMPRLEHFSRAHPDIDVRVLATSDLTDFRDGQTDIAIRFGLGNYEGVHVERLVSETMAPMCAPSLHAKHPILHPADLRKHHLIHDISTSTVSPDWNTWLQLAGVIDADAQRGSRFTLAQLALQSAINGYGVVLGRVTLARDYLNSGALMMPFNLQLPVNYAYYLVTPRLKHQRAEAIAFQNWIRTIC